MQEQRRPEMPQASILEPTTPIDIGERTQRRRIVEAMIESCAEKTFAATTIADIVARARISRTTFYKRFNDKRECFQAAVDVSLEELRATVVASHCPDDPPPRAVRRAIVVLLDALAARPGLGQLLTCEAIAVEPRIVERYRKLVVPALEQLWGRGEGSTPLHLDPRVSFGQAQVLILGKVAAGQVDRLQELLPELTYLAVVPFAGHEEGLRQARPATAEGSPGGSGER